MTHDVFIVYNDGVEWRRCRTEREAEEVVRVYDGDHSVWYEKQVEPE